MPVLPFYADDLDFKAIARWLNASEELAFIVSDDPGRWVAKRTVPVINRPRHCLWHVPSGLLPLLHSKSSNLTVSIADPWAGWEELRSGADLSVPYFGPEHPGVMWLDAWPASRRAPQAIGLSSFEWIGNHYSRVGQSACPATEKFWRSMKRWIQRSTTKITRNGPLAGPMAEVFAFPSAFAAFHNGVLRAENPD